MRCSGLRSNESSVYCFCSDYVVSEKVLLTAVVIHQRFTYFK